MRRQESETEGTRKQTATNHRNLARWPRVSSWDKGAGKGLILRVFS